MTDIGISKLVNVNVKPNEKSATSVKKYWDSDNGT